MRLGIALDWIGYDPQPEMTDYLVAHGLPEPETPMPTISSIFSWAAWWGVDLATFLAHLYNAAEQGAVCRDGPMTPGYRDCVHELRGRGHEVILLDGRPEIAREHTHHWLGVNQINFTEIGDHATSAPHAWALARVEVGLTAIPWAWHDLSDNGFRVHLWDRPWNRHVTTAFRVSTFSEFDAAIRRLEIADDAVARSATRLR